jgi:hypothetical protein
MDGADAPATDLLETAFGVPRDVVYRTFAHETVVLNLKTGRYHGLNPTAGAMLAELERGITAREAATKLAEHYGRPLPEVEEDLVGLCRDLLARGLIEASPKAGDTDGG